MYKYSVLVLCQLIAVLSLAVASESYVVPGSVETASYDVILSDG